MPLPKTSWAVVTRLSSLMEAVDASKHCAQCTIEFCEEEGRLAFEELTLRFGRLLRDGLVPPQRLERWNAVLRRHQEACARYNQQPLLTMESLLFSLRRVP